MTRQSIGEALAARIYAAETAIDRAMGETAALAAALPGARAEAYLSAVTGQRAFIGAAASLSALAVARGHLVDTHNTLAAALPGARAEAYLSAVTGQRAFIGAAASLSALAEARGHLVDTHNTLAALARKLGLDSLAVGPVDKPGDTPPIGGGAEPNAGRSGVVNKSLPNTAKVC